MEDGVPNKPVNGRVTRIRVDPEVDEFLNGITKAEKDSHQVTLPNMLIIGKRIMQRKIEIERDGNNA
jgi:hypothetical protein